MGRGGELGKRGQEDVPIENIEILFGWGQNGMLIYARGKKHANEAAIARLSAQGGEGGLNKVRAHHFLPPSRPHLPLSPSSLNLNNHVLTIFSTHSFIPNFLSTSSIHDPHHPSLPSDAPPPPPLPPPSTLSPLLPLDLVLPLLPHPLRSLRSYNDHPPPNGHPPTPLWSLPRKSDVPISLHSKGRWHGGRNRESVRGGDGDEMDSEDTDRGGRV